MFGNRIEQRRGIALKQLREQPPDRAAIGQAQHVPDLRGLHFAIAVHVGMGNRLVEDRQTVADRAFRRLRDQIERFLLCGHTFLADDHPEMGRQLFRADPLQIEPLAAR